MSNTRVNLWGDSIKILSEKEKTDEILKKINNPKQTAKKNISTYLKSDKLSIESKIKLIEELVSEKLGVYKNNTLVITSYDDYTKYIDKAISNGIIALDTETNRSVDPLTCKLMGLCIYTPGLKAAYVPVNHIDYKTNERVEELNEEQIGKQLQRLVDNNVKIIYHNAKFDYQVIKCTCGVVLPIYWDTMIGSQILDENESAALKYQYMIRVDSSVGEYDIEEFYSSLPYEIIPVYLFALYSATDAYITFKLYEYQKKEFEKPNNKGLYNLFLKVEMPVVLVVAEMELRGVCIDLEFAKRLSNKFHKKLDDIDKKIDKELESYKPKIAAWRLTEDAKKREPIIDKKTGLQKLDAKGNPMFTKSKNDQLEDPVNMGSPTQKAILIYDVLGIKSPDKNKSRSTDKATLAKLDFPLGKLISKRNNYEHLLNSFVDTLPTMLNPKDGKLHGNFHQLGKEEHNVVTGRFSSSNPNLQQIPAKGEGVSIRMMFKPTPGYVMLGSDYSSQEPKLLTQYSQDEKMLQTFEEGKNLYSAVAALVYHNNYEDNLEFFPDGTMNIEGKKRRANCKSVILGLMYGRGVKSIAEQIKSHSGDVTKEDIKEANDLIDAFFENYPKAKEWIDGTKHDVKCNEYVEDLWGRRRRLPDINLPKYEFKKINAKAVEFTPLLGGEMLDTDVDEDTKNKYIEMFKKAYSDDDRTKVEQKAYQEGIIAKDNGWKISKAERQSVNARIQGGAASMTKIAMINLFNDKRLKELDFHILIPVHDELICECPIENVEECKKLLSDIMANAGKPECQVAMKCDADSFPAWYYDVMKAHFKEDFEDMIKDKSKDEVFNILLKENSEFTEEQMRDFLGELY